MAEASSGALSLLFFFIVIYCALSGNEQRGPAPARCTVAKGDHRRGDEVSINIWW
jgi:hypothetical protein